METSTKWLASRLVGWTLLSSRTYRVGNISAPIVLYYGGSDSLVEIDAMLAELPRHAIVEVVPHYEHLDFLWANDVDKEVYPGILNYLRQYDGTIDSRHVAQTEVYMNKKVH